MIQKPVLGVQGIIKLKKAHGSDSTEYSFHAERRSIYVLEDNFANMYRAYFISSGNSIVLMANALSTYLSVNSETHKRIHITCAEDWTLIQLTQATAYNLYEIKLYN